MNDNPLALHAQNLLEIAETAYLTTIDRCERPQTRAMFNLRNRAQFPNLHSFFAGAHTPYETWFTTNTSSSKMLDLAENRAVSVYYCLPSQFRGLMLGGDMEIVDAPVEKALLWQEGWELYYPLGPEDPDYILLRLRPNSVKYFHQLQRAVLVG
jgi:general stress protein 26